MDQMKVRDARELLGDSLIGAGALVGDDVNIVAGESLSGGEANDDLRGAAIGGVDGVDDVEDFHECAGDPM